MRISVLYWMMACTESDGTFQSFAELRQHHQAAQQHIQEGNLQEGIEDFRRLHQEDPYSRALLESLLTTLMTRHLSLEPLLVPNMCTKLLHYTAFL